MPDAPLPEKLTIVPLEAEHLLRIEQQPSQRYVLGRLAVFSEEEAEAHASQKVAYTAFLGDRIMACMLIYETFPDQVGVAYAVLAEGLGRHHLQLTRFIKGKIEESRLPRIEVIAPCWDIEDLAALHPEFDAWQLVQAALRVPTPEVRWALLLGLKPAHVLRKYGGRCESFMLFERIR